MLSVDEVTVNVFVSQAHQTLTELARAEQTFLAKRKVSTCHQCMHVAMMVSSCCELQVTGGTLREQIVYSRTHYSAVSYKLQVGHLVNRQCTVGPLMLL